MLREQHDAASPLVLSPERLEGMRRQVDARLADFFQEAKHESRLSCAVRHGLLSPGKRLRPIITLLACEQCGGDAAGALDAACAVEMIHAASLIMDDLPAMDDAHLRRGNLATHVVFGEGTGLLAAIALLNEAYRVIALAPTGEADQKVRAIAHLAGAVGLEGLAGGQERDISCARAPELSLKEMEQRHTEKTGVLFAAAAAIGAELAGANAQTVAAMSRYGNALGLAYQAFDDVIDTFCTQETAGKDVDQDSGKSTVVSLLGQDGARRSATRWLERSIEIAEGAAVRERAPLAELSRLIGEKFRALTS